ncbi:MAG: MBL fold metallo-hydrolase [Cycloclasticus sp.]|nr:MBL fold metallo-hydrolase [Cycloclasticus sp.]
MLKKINALQYPISSKPEFGVPLEVSEGIFLLKMPIPYALDHINLWLLRDNSGWTIVDSGYYSEEAAALWDKVLTGFCDNQPIQKIVITHFHPDHVGMAQWLANKTMAPIHMSQIEYLTAHMACQTHSEPQKASRQQYFKRFGLTQEQLEGLQGRIGGYVNGVPEAPIAYHRMVDTESLSINNETWSLLQFSGHSPGHICLFNAERKILISGDQILPSISPNISVNFNETEADPLADYLSSLTKLATLDKDTLVLPAHGRTFIGVQERSNTLTQGHLDSLEQLRAFCQTPRTGLEVIEEMFGNRLSIFNLSLATGEAMAHLNYLIGTAEISRSDETVYHYKTN